MNVSVLDTVVRRSGLAVRVVDAATGKPVGGGVEVAVWPQSHPATRITGGPPTRSGLIGFRTLPGLGRYEDGSTKRSEWFTSPIVSQPQAFTALAVDRQRRYLPAVRSILVPAAHPIELGLTPAPSAAAPPGYGLVVGQAVRDNDGGPAAWALVRVVLRTTVAGGVADARGMFAVHVPLSATPDAVGSAATGPQWTATVSVRYHPTSQVWAPGTTAEDPPTFESIASQQGALVVDRGFLAADLQRVLSRSGPLVVASAAPPPPSTLRVRPAA